MFQEEGPNGSLNHLTMRFDAAAQLGVGQNTLPAQFEADARLLGAVAMIIASEAAAKGQGLTLRARILGMASAGVAPRVMGIGPVPATEKLLARLGLSIDRIDAIELNEAFASQALAVLRGLHVEDADPRVIGHGGAIALGHPLGMSGARLVQALVYRLERGQGRIGLATLCVGVGQGLSLAVEKI
jgi:acetyl-CoA acetyltransferase